MKVILQDHHKYILRFDKSEEIISLLKDFCRKENICAGYFSGIGAAEEVILSSYSLKKKEYSDKNLKGEIEIASLTGNITYVDSKAAIHTHGIFSDDKFRCFAGHVKKVVISVTAEVVLEKLEGFVKRKYNQKVGLNLME